MIRTGIHGSLLVNEREKPDVNKPGIRIVKTNTPPDKCSFCPGNEHMTPPELGRIEKLRAVQPGEEIVQPNTPAF